MWTWRPEDLQKPGREFPRARASGGRQTALPRLLHVRFRRPPTVAGRTDADADGAWLPVAARGTDPRNDLSGHAQCGRRSGSGRLDSPVDCQGGRRAAFGLAKKTSVSDLARRENPMLRRVTKRRQTSYSTLTALALLVCGSSAAEDWPRYGHDGALTGRSAAAGRSPSRTWHGPSSWVVGNCSWSCGRPRASIALR